MIICNSNCSIWESCEKKEQRQRCYFDLGVFDREEDDDYIEKLSY